MRALKPNIFLIVLGLCQSHLSIAQSYQEQGALNPYDLIFYLLLGVFIFQFFSLQSRSIKKKFRNLFSIKVMAEKCKLIQATYRKLFHKKIKINWTKEDALVDMYEKNIRSVFDASFEGIVVHDRGIILDANKAFISMLGHPREEIMGTSIGDYCAYEETECKDTVIETICGGKKKNLKVRFETKDGKELVVDLYSKPYTFRGHPVNITSARDITEQIEKQKIIDYQKEKMLANSKMSALGVMASGIAHEINSPLAVMTTAAEQIQYLVKNSRGTEQDIIQATKKIAETGMRVAKIIRGLQSFSRDSKQDPFEYSPLLTIFQDALELCKRKLERSGIELVMDQSIPSELLIECRATEICQVLVNLLSNAIDASSDAKDRWIKVDFVDNGQYVDICITDSGPGIPTVLEEKIFQPFFSTKDPGKGTGLGLSISWEIVHSHLGKLFLDPQSEKTRFVLRLLKKVYKYDSLNISK